MDGKGPIIGKGPPGGAPPGKPLGKIDVNIEELPVVKCRNCGGILWQQAFHIRKISPLISPTGKEEFGTMPVLVCLECKTEMKTSVLAQKLEEEAKRTEGSAEKPEEKK